LTLRVQRLRDQAGTINYGVIPGIEDRAQCQDQRERAWVDVSRDRLTDPADQIAGRPSDSAGDRCLSTIGRFTVAAAEGTV
jgi:hypothetical protein